MRMQIIIKRSLLLLIALLSLLTPSFCSTTSPIFVTTVTNIFEASSAVLSTSSPTTSGGFSSQSTSITYTNFYFTTPVVGYGVSFINSNWIKTTAIVETIFDLSISTKNATVCTLKLNFTASTILQFSINYFVCLPNNNFFLDVVISYQDLNSYNTINTSSLTGQRSITLNLPYKGKSNASNAVVGYNTVGLSMMRQSNTF